MLNFSKINILIIYLIFFTLAIFSLLNFQEKNKEFIDKKINLGLDLQGGSYLLLEINSDTLVKEKIQGKVIPIKKLLKENNVEYSSFKINNKSLLMNINDVDKFDLLFYSRKNNLVNPETKKVERIKKTFLKSKHNWKAEEKAFNLIINNLF